MAYKTEEDAVDELTIEDRIIQLRGTISIQHVL